MWGASERNAAMEHQWKSRLVLTCKAVNGRSENGLFCQTLIKKYDKCPSTARTRTKAKDIFDFFLPRMNPNLTVFVAGSYQYRLLFGSV